MSIRTTFFVLTFTMIAAGTVGAADRAGPTGSASRSFGPQGGATVSGQRAVTGNDAASSFTAAGPRGRNAAGQASSTVAGGKASGQASVTTSTGRSLNAQGQGAVTGINSVAGSGSVGTAKGYGATGTGTASRNADGTISANGTATTNAGRSATVSGTGTKEGGSATVTTGQGSKTVSYGNQR